MNQRLFTKIAIGARYAMLLAAAAAPWTTHAQKASEKIIGIACDIFSLLYSIALVVGIIYVVIAAFKYMTAAGDATKVSEGHRALTWAAIGIGVAIIAAGVPGIVGSILGDESITSKC